MSTRRVPSHSPFACAGGHCCVGALDWVGGCVLALLLVSSWSPTRRLHHRDTPTCVHSTSAFTFSNPMQAAAATRTLVRPHAHLRPQPRRIRLVAMRIDRPVDASPLCDSDWTCSGVLSCTTYMFTYIHLWMWRAIAQAPSIKRRVQEPFLSCQQQPQGVI